MRKYIAVSFLCLSVFVLSARAQDPEKIIKQYIKAVGGAKNLSRIQTTSIEGTFTAGSGDEKSGAYTCKLKQPNRYYSEIVVGDKNLIHAYNGKSAWSRDAAGNIATLLGPEGVQLETAARYYNSHLLDPKKDKLGAAFVGSAQVRGRPALQLELTTTSGLKREVFFDAQTHLIAEESADLAGVPEEIFYDEYRPVNGVQFPGKIELHHGGDVFDITVTRVLVNETIGERVFDFPVKSQVKLPDLKTLFKEIDDNQKQTDKIKENYAGARSEEETEYDKTGKITKKEIREYTFFYLDGDEVSTLIRKDGKPLSDEEQKKENEKAQKQIQEIQKREKKKEAKEEKAKEKGKEEKSEDPGIETFLSACQFVNPRRERFRGRDVLVFDFERNPEYKPKNMVERIVQQLAGVVWIDEQAREAVRLEAYFVNNAKIAGGLLANLQKGTGFVFEQEYVNNEVWLPTYEEAHVNVRVLLVKGFKINEVTRYSDYKRFNVETVNKIAKPKQAETAEPQ
jgi:hypothetical protein